MGLTVFLLELTRSSGRFISRSNASVAACPLHRVTHTSRVIVPERLFRELRSRTLPTSSPCGASEWTILRKRHDRLTSSLLTAMGLVTDHREAARPDVDGRARMAGRRMGEAVVDDDEYSASGESTADPVCMAFPR